MTTLNNSWQEITRGSFNTGYGVFSVILIACCSEDVSGNYSTVSTMAEWELTNGSISFDSWHVGLDTTGTSGGYTNLGACSPQGLVQSSWTVAHNEDGTGTASVGISWDCTYGLTSWSDRQTVDLPTIPRKSNVSLSASSVVLDGHSSVTIYTNRKSSSFSHTLKYSVVPYGSPFITFASGVGDSYTWVPPTNWYGVIVNGSNTYTIRCETYSGGTYIGSTDVGLTITSAGISQASLSTPSITLDGSNRVVIYTNKRCDTFTHTIQQNFSGNFENIGTGVVDSVPWTPTPDYYNTIGGGSKTFTIRCYTYNGVTQIGYVDNSFTINSIGADDVSAPDMTMGSEYTVSISKRLSSFRHTLIWSFAGASGSIGSDKGVDTSAPWTPSTSLAAQIKTSMSAQAVITCETFYGNTSIGTKQTRPTIYVPAYDIVLDTPAITEEGTCRDTNKTALTAKGVGANEVMALLSVKRLVVNATTSYYASITNISVSFGGTTKSVSSGSFNNTFSDMMNSELSISVTDSRNKVYSNSKQFCG